MRLSKFQNVMMWWDNSISVFTLTIVNVALALFNPNLFILLPISLGVDMLILFFATMREFNRPLKDMWRDSNLFTDINSYEGQLKDVVMSEMRRFRTFHEGNMFDTKDIRVYISEKLHGGTTAYTFWADESIILLHDEFDENNDIDIFKLIHEMFHCVYHCLIRQHRIMVRGQVLCLTVLIISSVLSVNLWIALTGLILCFALLFIESKTYDESRVEVEANAMTLTIFENLYGNTRKEKVAKIFCDIAFKQLSSKKLKDAIPIINEISKLSLFLTMEDRDNLVQRIEEKMAIAKEIGRKENETESKKENKRIRRNLLTLYLLIRIDRNKSQLGNYRNGYMTWSPSLYYILFPMLMYVYFLAMKNMLIEMIISWWAVLLVLIPVILIFIIWREVMLSRCEKEVFIGRFINQNK